MAKCRFCGKDLSWFSTYNDCHEACRQKVLEIQKEAAPKIQEQISLAVKGNLSYSVVQNNLDQIISQYGIPAETLKQMVLDSADEISKEMPLSPETGDYLLELSRVIVGIEKEKCDVTALMQSGNPLHVRLFLVGFNVDSSNILWNLMHGKTWSAPTPCPFVLQPDEKEVTRFGLAIYQKSVMVSSHADGYEGIGIRIASGMYYRFGGYAGQSIATPEVQRLDNGLLSLTTKSIYFGGQQLTFRVPYTSILRFKAYPDGLGFFRSTGGGREELFTLVNVPLSPKDGNGSINPENMVTFQNGWFAYNVVTFCATKSA